MRHAIEKKASGSAEKERHCIFRGCSLLFVFGRSAWLGLSWKEEEGMVGHKMTLMEGTTLEHCTTQHCQQSNKASRAK